MNKLIGLAAIVLTTGCAGNKYYSCPKEEPKELCQPYWKVDGERPTYIEYAEKRKTF